MTHPKQEDAGLPPHLDTEIDILKRKLLQSLSSNPKSQDFFATKCLLLKHFFEPDSVSKLEFAPESAIVQLAADLNHEYYLLKQKRAKLEEAGLSKVLDARMKNPDPRNPKLQGEGGIKPKELINEELLAQYNHVAQKVWEERLLQGVSPTKIIPNPHQNPAAEAKLFELDGWRSNEAEALQLLQKYKPDAHTLHQKEPEEHPLSKVSKNTSSDGPKVDPNSSKKPPTANGSEKSGATKTDPAEQLLNKLRGGPSLDSIKQAHSPHASEEMLGFGAANKQSAKSLQPGKQQRPIDESPSQKRNKFSNNTDLEEATSQVQGKLASDIMQIVQNPGQLAGISDTNLMELSSNTRPKSARGNKPGSLFTDPIPKAKLIGQDTLIDSASGLQDFSMALKDKSGFGSSLAQPKKDPAPVQPPPEEISGGAYSMFSASGSSPSKPVPQKDRNEFSQYHPKAQEYSYGKIDERLPSADEFEDEFLVREKTPHNKDSAILELSKSNIPQHLGGSTDKFKQPNKKTGLEDLDLEDFDDF